MRLDAFFFGDELFGVWREVADAKIAWVIAPPFGEEEKSARRTLTDVAQVFQARGEASLLFSFRGCGDSGGDFSRIGLEEWRSDFESAIIETQKRAPGAEIALLGVRLGASLALQVAAAREDVAQVVLIEPLLSGRSFLSQQLMRQKIRAQMTGDSAAPKVESDVEDLDGWPLGGKMKSELQALDVMKQSVELRSRARVIQVGPKSEVAPPLRALGEKINAQSEAVVMPPFWNLLDYADPIPLLTRL